MNIYKNLIFIKQEDKTSEIVSCNYNNGKYDIQYKSSKEVYKYGYLSVNWLRDPLEISPDSVRISHNGTTYFDIRQIVEFGEYWRIMFRSGMNLCYLKSQLKIEKNCIFNENGMSYFEYFKSLADKVSLKTDDGKNILAGQYEKISFISEESILAAYLKPDNSVKQGLKRQRMVCFPFGCNNSQIQAVNYALSNKISVIEGPPGTGKTQTILNIIANIVMDGKTVAVVSNNNSATENVLEKLEKSGFGYITASLGKSENKKSFVSSKQSKYPDFNECKYDIGTILELKRHTVELQNELDDMLLRQNRLAEVKAELKAFELEKQYFDEYYNETYNKNIKLKVKLSVSSNKVLKLWISCQSNYELNEKITIWFKIKSVFIYGLYNLKFFNQSIQDAIPSLLNSYYKIRSIELSNEIANIEQYLKAYSFKDKMNEMVNASQNIFKYSLCEKYCGATERTIFTEEDLYKNSAGFNHEYPVILSTTHSLRSSLNADYVYDYVIVDEASQVDLLTGVLTLSCARNIVVVGDLMQLPNVISETIKKQAKVISDLANIADIYRYEEQSLLSSICEVFTEVPRTLLREHYRCHPKIIEFCNQKFYDNQLIIMTEDNNEKDVLKVYKTVAGNHGRGHYNQRQIDEIKETILPELRNNSESNDIGIIAPYRDQTVAIGSTIEKFDVSTVHKFQGREKDDIIISTVDNEITEFTDNANMLNVAVSRAKNRLRIVMSDNEENENTNIGDLVRYIQYHNFEVVKSEIYSIFDLLYSAYAEQRKIYLKNHRKISMYDSETITFGLIEDVLMENEYHNLAITVHQPLNMLIKDPKKLSDAECVYAMNCATHLDFVIYNRLDMSPILVIETDGYDFHKKGTRQAERDVMKDKILNKYEMPLLRFKTNGSREKEILIEKLRGLSVAN